MKRGLILSLLLPVSAAFAETWTLDTSQHTTSGNYSINLSESFGGEGQTSWWLDSSGASMSGQGFSASDNVVINNPFSSDRLDGLVIDVSEVEINNLTAGGTTWVFIKAPSFGNNKFTINGDLTNTGNLQIYQLDLHIKGDINTGGKSLALGRGNNTGQANYRVLVDGNVYGGSTLYVNSNGLIRARSAEENTFENGLANPDTIIRGQLIDTILYSMADPTYDAYIQVGGLSGSASAMRENTKNVTNSKTSYIILANTQDCTTSGYVREYASGLIYTPEYGKTTFVMNGTASQEFTSNNLLFFGGVKAISGTIKMNFNQGVSNYTYKTPDGLAVKFYSDAAGQNLTTFSHGDLELSGGTFASASGSSTYGSFRFTNIKYESGTITLRLESATQMDSLDISGYYSQTGDEALVRIDGGTLTREGSSKITFQFEGDLTWLIDDGTGSFDINDGNGAKIVSWDSGKGSALASDDFAANNFESSGDMYKAYFEVLDDGLYVKYVAVPEPAEIAAMLGAIALGFAVCRRRK